MCAWVVKLILKTMVMHKIRIPLSSEKELFSMIFSGKNKNIENGEFRCRNFLFGPEISVTSSTRCTVCSL